MGDLYSLRVVRRGSSDEELILAVAMTDPGDVAEIVRELLMNRTAPHTQPGDTVIINLMGDFERWKRGEQ